MRVASCFICAQYRLLMVSIELQRNILTNSNKLQLSIILPIFIIGHVSQNMIVCSPFYEKKEIKECDMI